MGMLDSIKALPTWAKVGGVAAIGGIAYLLLRPKGEEPLGEPIVYAGAPAAPPAEVSIPELPTDWELPGGGVWWPPTEPGPAPEPPAWWTEPPTWWQTPEQPEQPEFWTVEQRAQGYIEQYGLRPLIGMFQWHQFQNLPSPDPEVERLLRAKEPELFRISFHKPVAERVAGHMRYFGSAEEYRHAIEEKRRMGVPIQDPEAAEYFLRMPSKRRRAIERRVKRELRERAPTISWHKPVKERAAGHAAYFGSAEAYAAAIKEKERKGIKLDDPAAAAAFKRAHPELFD